MSAKLLLVVAAIALVACTGVSSAWGDPYIYTVDWKNPHKIGTSTYIDVHIKNPDYRDMKVDLTMQLSVPGWYTRNFGVSATARGGTTTKVTLPFTLEQNWPTGNYNAKVYCYVQGVGNTGARGGTIRVGYF